LEGNVRAKIPPAFSDCSRKITNKGYDVFDTPALALSHPLNDPDGVTDGEEKNSQSAPDIAEETRHQGAEDKGQDAIPPPIPQARVANSAAFGPTGNYQLSPLFERTFIDLGRLMVEEGFNLITYTQIEGLLREDWKIV
jgi:hypothetical protein